MERVALVVDDIPSEVSKYGNFLKEMGYKVLSAETEEEAINLIKECFFDLALIDMHLTQQQMGEGANIVRFIHDNYPQTIIIAMSVDPNYGLISRVRQLGAISFLKKPISNTDELAICLDSIVLNKRNKQDENNNHERLLKKKRLNEIAIDGIVISEQQRTLATQVAKNRKVPITIIGETGTGKEELAKLIHKKRVEFEGSIPLVSVNCASLEGDLVASILFGHKKGSFSGADKTTNGLVGEADGGILFLDEIHTLNLSCQKKLLRVLNDGKYTRLGDTVELRSNFQVIVATTKDLDEAVDCGDFLLDLRSRLTGIDFKLLPLRERKEEIEDLIRVFFANQEPYLEIADNTIKKLTEKCKSFYWQGNIRQMFKVLEAMMIYANLNDKFLDAEDMPVYKTMLAPNSSIQKFSNNEIKYPENIKKLLIDGKISSVLDEFEKIVIEYRVKNSLSLNDACQSLGISRSSLYRKRLNNDQKLEF